MLLREGVSTQLVSATHIFQLCQVFHLFTCEGFAGLFEFLSEAIVVADKAALVLLMSDGVLAHLLARLGETHLQLHAMALAVLEHALLCFHVGAHIVDQLCLLLQSEQLRPQMLNLHLFLREASHQVAIENDELLLRVLQWVLTVAVGVTAAVSLLAGGCRSLATRFTLSCC